MQSAEGAGWPGVLSPRHCSAACLGVCRNLPKRDPQDSMHPQHLGSPTAPHHSLFTVGLLATGSRGEGCGPLAYHQSLRYCLELIRCLVILLEKK